MGYEINTNIVEDFSVSPSGWMTCVMACKTASVNSGLLTRHYDDYVINAIVTSKVRV